MRKTARAALAATAMALVALTAAPAHADGAIITEYAYGALDAGNCTLGGKATFKPYGEILEITDLCKDGHSAIGVLHIPSGDYYYWNSGGVGTTRTVDLSYAEGTPVVLQACLGDWSGTPTGGIIWSTCSPGQQTTA